jgi:hypothetical protein
VQADRRAIGASDAGHSHGVGGEHPLEGLIRSAGIQEPGVAGVVELDVNHAAREECLDFGPDGSRQFETELSR